MLAFRSEEHVETWCATRGFSRGATMSPEQQWRLADAWYAGRLALDWRRKSAEEAETLFGELGLTGAFWRLRP